MAAVNAALGESRASADRRPSDRELADTKANFVGKVALRRETPQQVAGELWRAELYGLPAITSIATSPGPRQLTPTSA